MIESAWSLYRDRNIVLIGFMGAGKTTVGELVAKKLNRDFVDTDQELEKMHNMSIPQIFAQKGEEYFRRQERNLISGLCEKARRKVISPGGGAFLQEEVRRVCLEHCIVFFLDLSWDYWKEERYPLIRDNRPVLQNKTMEEIKQLFFQRRNAYAFNHSKIVIKNQNDAKQAADRIVESIRLAHEMEEPSL